MSENELASQYAPVLHRAPGLTGWAERGWIPDALLRAGIRRLCAQRLRTERHGGSAVQEQRYQQRLRELLSSPIAVHTAAANSQHYELPTAFFELCLGRRLKYSCAFFEHGTETLDQAEEAMLALYGERAELADGQEILELGCGWGSLTLWMAEQYPRARIVAITNSREQRAYIETRCRLQGLQNVRVQLADINRLQLAPQQFDRCVSVEMFEHVRNYRELFGRLTTWLRPGGGKLFVHIFAHRTLMYPFETEGEGNWLGRHFFTGGLMPAADALLWFQGGLQLKCRWLVDGTHYQRTAEAWLRNQDRNRHQVREILAHAYGADAAALWAQRWRMFWMSCAELFGYAGGNEWLVAHYSFERGS